MSCSSSAVALLATVIAVAALLSSPASAAVCGGAGFNLSPLSFADYVLNDTAHGYVYYFHPCGNVTAPGCQTLENQIQGGTMFCQLPYSGPPGYSLATWTGVTQAATVWTPLPGRQGVRMTLADGEGCGSSTGTPRSINVAFTCDRTLNPGQATITGLAEVSTCNYAVNVSTLAACPSLSASTCGTTRNGVSLDLTSITGSDLVFKTPAPTNYTYYFRPCGTVTSPQCANNPYGQVAGQAMMCQATGQNGELDPNTYDLAWWNPTLATWRPIRGGRAWRMEIQDGTTCDAAGGISRALTVDFYCVPSATTPIFTLLNETSTCNYYANITTAAACTNASQGLTIDTNPECGGTEFDLEFASAKDLVYTTPDGSTQYVFRPCGVVSNLVCQNAATTNQSMMCQSYPGSTSTYNVASWNGGTTTTWTPTLLGIQQFTQDGDFCAADGQQRSLTVNYVCIRNPNPQFIQFINFSEPNTCQYLATVGTSAVCRTGRGQGLCGSAGYDFSLSAGSEYQLTAADNSYIWYFQPCGTVRAAVCANQMATAASMMCQAQLGGGAAYQVATYDYNAVNWLQVTNGWLMFVQDGTTCVLSGGTYNRALKVYFYCNTGTAFSTPTFFNVTEDPNQQCSYIATIYTPQACAPVAAGASTGAYIAPGSDVGSTGAYGYEAASQCGGPYNLVSLSTTDLSWTGNGYQWIVRPCGAVSNSNCTAAAYASGTAGWQLCQNSLTGGDYEGSIYTPWSTIYQPTRYGVRMITADGSQCGTLGARVTMLNFVCNQSATSAVLVNVTEGPTCTYTAVIQTNLVCPTAATTCGGAGFDLSPLTTRGDLQYVSNSTGYNYYFAPCEVVQNSQCQMNAVTQGSMMCQASTSSNATYNLASYIPQAISWSANSDGSGVTMTVQDGSTCDGYDYERKLVVNFQCGTNNGYQFLSIVESPRCLYTAVIRTGLACGGSSGGGSGLSGGAIAGIVIGSVVGALVLLGLLLLVCCGASTLRFGGGKKTSSDYGAGDEGVRGQGKFNDLEPSSSHVEMETHSTTPVTP